jgi:hypothetical protein
VQARRIKVLGRKCLTILNVAINITVVGEQQCCVCRGLAA